MKRSNFQYASLILLGEMTLDDVPEIRRSWVSWFINRVGPAGPTDHPAEVLEHLMKELEKAHAEIDRLRHKKSA